MSIIFDVREFEKASSGSVIRLLPQPNDTHPYYSDYDAAALAVDAIVNRAPLHASGPSGTGKSHFFNSLLFGPPENMARICEGLGLPRWPRVKCHRVFVSEAEGPHDVWYKTGVVRFTTVEQPQKIIRILEEAAGEDDVLHVVWLLESGRGITASVQGGWLEIIGQDTIREPHGRMFELKNVAFVTDSNHSANDAGQFAIYDLDQAFGRRWVRRITLRPLSPEQEAAVLGELMPRATEQQVSRVVTLAAAIRARHAEGGLHSILPPSIDAELDLLGCICRLRIDAHTIVFSNLLGHCAERDREEAETIFAEAFGVRVKADTPAAEAVGVL